MDSYTTTLSQIEQLEPFVMYGCVDDWKATGWTQEHLAKIVHPAKEDELLRIRLGPKEHLRGKILFENESKMAYISSLEQFFKWFAGETTITTDDCCAVDETHYWAYFDYNYVFDIMNPEDITDINWRSIGLDADPVDSTIWIGTPGAYTPCHYDSYGYNVHAQLSGSKRWILFEPSENMKATRIPYEESTVFSSLDVIGADKSVQGKKIRMVTLNKGDVIFVPPGWWHCVQCINVNGNVKDVKNVSVSVNTWISLTDYDRIAQLHEAAASTMVTFLNRAGLIEAKHICPSESMLCYDDSLHNFRKVFREAKNEKTTDESFPILLKFLAKQKARMQNVPIVSFDDLRAAQTKGPLKIVDVQEDCICSSNFPISATNTSLFQRHFINSLLSERVLTALITQLEEWI